MPMGQGVCKDALLHFCCLPILLDMAGKIRYDVGYQVKGGIKMNVKISFDKAAVEQRGLTLEHARQSVKSLFAVH